MIIGIDLGTAFSLAAAFDNQGALVLIPDMYDKTAYYTPSIVHIKGSNCSVGLMALQLLEQTSDANLIRFFKRYLGEDKELYLSPGKNETWYPEGIAALVLKKIINDAEQFLTDPIEGAVITVPAHFTDAQRKAVINAAALIDLKIVGLIEEPVAAALHYGIKNKSKNQNILVYDLGGGTFDATLLSITDESVIVIGKDGISDLGGKEFDEAIANIIHEQFDKALGRPIDFTGKKLQQLRAIAESIKIELSMPGVTFINHTCLIGADSVDIFITRKEFEIAIRADIEKTGKILKRCLTSAGLDERDVDILLIVGGSSMIPCIKEYLIQFMPTLAGKTKFHEPIKAVAFGAALYGKIISKSTNQFDSNLPKDVKGVTGYNVAVRAMNPFSGDVVLDVIIKKNRPLPTHSMKNYFTAENSNGKMRVELVQFIEEDDVKTLGFLNVGPLPSNVTNYQIDVTVNCLEDSTISLKAFDPKSGLELQKTFSKNGMDANYLVKQKSLISKTIVNNVH